MKNNKFISRILTFMVFILLAITTILGFASSRSTAFVQTFFILSIVTILITAIVLLKERNDVKPVIFSAVAYFSYIVVRGFIFIVASASYFFSHLRISNLNDRLYYNSGDYTQEEIDKLSDKIDRLEEISDRATFIEILDILTIVVSITFLVFSVIFIIRIIKNKNDEKSLECKVSNLVLGEGNTQATVNKPIDEQNFEID